MPKPARLSSQSSPQNRYPAAPLGLGWGSTTIILPLGKIAVAAQRCRVLKAPTGRDIPAQGRTLGTPRNESVRSEGTPHNACTVEAFRDMRRSYRTLNSGNLFPQGCTLGWYAAPRWGFPNTTPLHGNNRFFRGIIIVVEHHSPPQPCRTSQAKVAPKTPLSVPQPCRTYQPRAQPKNTPPAPTGQRIPAQGVTLGMTP